MFKSVSRTHASVSTSGDVTDLKNTLPRDDTAATLEQSPTRGVCASVDTGGLVVLRGLCSSVPLGSILQFQNGKKGLLLSHSEPKSFVLLYTRDASGRVVVDHDYKDADMCGLEANTVPGVSGVMYGPGSSATLGQVVTSLGECVEGVPELGERTPLIREPPTINDRKAISTPLLTGIKAVDLLAPLGRGQCMLVTGEPGTHLSQLGLTSIVAQKGKEVRCVYAAVGAQASQIGEVVEYLETADAMEYTTVVTRGEGEGHVMPEGAGAGAGYAATCSAMAIAESACAMGQDALLILDDVSGLIDFSSSMSRLTVGESSDRLSPVDGQERTDEEREILLSASLAERRRFIGAMLQRVARLNDQLGGGSITLLGVMYHPQGAYKKPKRRVSALPTSVEDITGFASMSPAVQDKLRRALEKKAAAAATATATATNDASPVIDTEGRVDSTQVLQSSSVQPRALVEEFMSITDGQILVEGYSSEEGWLLSTRDSVSRIGSPGAAGPFRSLDYLQLRLDLLRGGDMNNNKGEEKSALKDRSASIRGLLKQRPGEVLSLGEQAVGLLGIRESSGFAQNKTEDEIQQMVAQATRCARNQLPEVLAQINANPSEECSPAVISELTQLYADILKSRDDGVL